MRRHIGSRPGPRAATLARHCQRMNANVPVLPGASGKGVAAATRRAKHLGAIRKRRVQSLSQKYLSFRKSEIVIEYAVPCHKGAYRDRHESRRGMRWTQWPQGDARQGGRQRRVVLVPRRWDQARGRFSRATEAKKPGTPGRARYKP